MRILHLFNLQNLGKAIFILFIKSKFTVTDLANSLLNNAHILNVKIQKEETCEKLNVHIFTFRTVE